MTRSVHSSDSYGMYLKEINDYPLLKLDEEIALAGRIAKGDERAYDRLVECNLRLVIEFSRDYVGRWLRREDIVAIGNIGLMRAARKYNPYYNFEKYKHPLRFSTVARWWIRQAIERELDTEGRSVHYTIAAGSKVRVVMRMHRDGYDIESIVKRVGLPEDEVVNMIWLESGPLSFDKPLEIGFETMPGATLHEIIPDSSAPAPDATVSNDSVHKALARLPEDERLILRMTYGLSGKVYRDADIAKQLSRDLSHVRTLRARALAKLASPSFHVEDDNGRTPNPVVHRRTKGARRALPEEDD